METFKLHKAAVASLLTLLASCGGGGGANPMPTNASAGGIWRGTESTSGLQVVGLVDEAGEFHFIRSDNVQYVGSASVAGNALTANVEGFVPFGFEFPDGSTHGTGTISATIQARSTIDASTQFQTDAGTASNGTLSLTFDALYNRASSLTTISGNFTNPQTGVVVTVGSDGSVFSQDPSTGCVLNGTVTVIDAAYNAYRVQYDYANCAGQTAALNGVQFSGLATLDNTVTPERVLIGSTGQSGSVKYAAVITLDRT